MCAGVGAWARGRARVRACACTCRSFQTVDRSGSSGSELTNRRRSHRNFPIHFLLFLIDKVDRVDRGAL